MKQEFVGRYAISVQQCQQQGMWAELRGMRQDVRRQRRGKPAMLARHRVHRELAPAAQERVSAPTPSTLRTWASSARARARRRSASAETSRCSARSRVKSNGAGLVDTAQTHPAPGQRGAEYVENQGQQYWSKFDPNEEERSISQDWNEVEQE